MNQKIRILNYLWIEAEKTSSDYYFHVQHEVAILICQTKKKPQKAFLIYIWKLLHQSKNACENASVN